MTHEATAPAPRAPHESRLRRAREGAGLTLELAATATGIDPQRLQDLEDGRTAVRPGELTALSEAYGTGPGQVLLPRRPVGFDPSTGDLDIGGVTQHVGTAPDNEAVYAAYLSLLYAVRGAERGEELPLRASDLDVLLTVVGEDPADLERRLVALMGCTPEEASLLGRVLLRHRALAGSVGVAATLSLVALVGLGAHSPSSSSSALDVLRPGVAVAAPAQPVDLPSTAVQQLLRGSSATSRAAAHQQIAGATAGGAAAEASRVLAPPAAGAGDAAGAVEEPGGEAAVTVTEPEPPVVVVDVPDEPEGPHDGPEEAPEPDEPQPDEPQPGPAETPVDQPVRTGGPAAVDVPAPDATTDAPAVQAPVDAPLLVVLPQDPDEPSRGVVPVQDLTPGLDLPDSGPDGTDAAPLVEDAQDVIDGSPEPDPDGTADEPRTDEDHPGVDVLDEVLPEEEAPAQDDDQDSPQAPADDVVDVVEVPGDELADVVELEDDVLAGPLAPEADSEDLSGDESGEEVSGPDHVDEAPDAHREPAPDLAQEGPEEVAELDTPAPVLDTTPPVGHADASTETLPPAETETVAPPAETETVAPPAETETVAPPAGTDTAGGTPDATTDGKGKSNNGNGGGPGGNANSGNSKK